MKLDNSNRVVKVKTINVRKEGGNAPGRAASEGGLGGGGLFGGVADALGQGARASTCEDSNQLTELRERAERAERRADRLEVDAGAENAAEALLKRARLRQRSARRPTARRAIERA